MPIQMFYHRITGAHILVIFGFLFIAGSARDSQTENPTPKNTFSICWFNHVCAAHWSGGQHSLRGGGGHRDPTRDAISIWLPSEWKTTYIAASRHFGEPVCLACARFRCWMSVCVWNLHRACDFSNHMIRSAKKTRFYLWSRGVENRIWRLLWRWMTFIRLLFLTLRFPNWVIFVFF